LQLVSSEREIKNDDPRVKLVLRFELCPLGEKLAPRGEDPLFVPPFF
jgi:hypothetical protein